MKKHLSLRWVGSWKLELYPTQRTLRKHRLTLLLITISLIVIPLVVFVLTLDPAMPVLYYAVVFGGLVIAQAVYEVRAIIGR